MIGTTLDGKYRITRQIGAGAMGAVYEAEHTGTNRRVAVKIITGDLARDESLVSRFQREAKAAGAIETQHITQVFDTGVDRDTGLPFMVMEFLVGEDFSQLLRRLGPIAPDLALRMVSQACLGLQKAHEAGVVHRDIKPANLFLARRDAGEIIVKLLDFGIAKVKMDRAQEMESAALTRTGNMLGSPLYMSPEQARGSKDIDHRTDIWSLAARVAPAGARRRASAGGGAGRVGGNGPAAGSRRPRVRRGCARGSGQHPSRACLQGKVRAHGGCHRDRVGGQASRVELSFAPAGPRPLASGTAPAAAPAPQTLPGVKEEFE